MAGAGNPLPDLVPSSKPRAPRVVDAARATNYTRSIRRRRRRLRHDAEYLTKHPRRVREELRPKQGRPIFWGEGKMKRGGRAEAAVCEEKMVAQLEGGGLGIFFCFYHKKIYISNLSLLVICPNPFDFEKGY